MTIEKTLSLSIVKKKAEYAINKENTEASESRYFLFNKRKITHKK